jgi:carboxyl-terminal processing protease
VGLELKIDGGYPVVVKVLAGGPADQAGLLPGDPLTQIEGVPTRGMRLGDVVMRLRGKPGSQASVTVERKGKRIIFVMLRGTMRRVADDYQAKER